VKIPENKAALLVAECGSSPPVGANSTRQQPPARQSARRFLQRGKLYLSLYALLIPTVLSLLVFSYYPKIDVFINSLYRWQPPSVHQFIGFQNFKEAFSDPQLWASFQLVGILLVVNLLKLWPGIFAAIALHRVRNDRIRYFIQVCFVVPMIIPAMVTLLIWKNFYDPDFGLVNRFLNLTGGMQLLDLMDRLMPATAALISPFQVHFLQPIWGGAGGLIFLGALIYLFSCRKTRDHRRWADYGVVMSGIFIIPCLSAVGLLSEPTSLTVVLTLAAFVAWLIFLSRRIGDEWVIWPIIVLAGWALFVAELWRLPIAVAAAVGLFELIRSRFDEYQSRPIFIGISLLLVGVGIGTILLGNLWTQPTGQFANGAPAWLGSQELVVPAVLFWGFPWVGTVGVLIYLSGLQSISEDVYEAAKLDGVTPVGMIFRIELPLIMTQVRINLIFMTIATLTTYEMFLILLGPDGGPGNKGMVPGLYMFSMAFSEGRFGYACAIGVILFVIILSLTIIYQRYVKVDK